ncbi:MAG: response regulator [Myxococcales bacterium]|nr:response regulator [Myxococcales bacterium]MCB9643691.1 response regulator [Myxococcales bacterium]
MQKAVLVIDDEPFLLRYIETVLKRFHYEVFCASDGYTALDLYQRHRQDIGLVLLDLTMPGMNGKETFQALRKINPDLEISFMSGYSDEEIKSLLPSNHPNPPKFLAKPFCTETLIKHLRSSPEDA